MMTKLLVVLAMLALLSACEQQKQASAEVGAIPKEILDKATNDLNAAQELAADKMKAAESEDAPADVSQ
jgi:outer membrane protein assembly factor BamD (BamD/ComL family)